MSTGSPEFAGYTKPIVHKYEFSSENPVTAFGAGWTLSGSRTAATFFQTGTTLDRVVNAINSLQDVDSPDTLEKLLVLHQAKYTRNTRAGDTCTVTYGTLSQPAGRTHLLVGNVSDREVYQFNRLLIGELVPNWTRVVRSVTYTRGTNDGDTCSITLFDPSNGNTMSTTGSVTNSEQIVFRRIGPAYVVPGWVISNAVIAYTRNLNPSDQCTITYKSNLTAPTTRARTFRTTGTVSTSELETFDTVTSNKNVTGWTISDRVYHAVVTSTTTSNQRSKPTQALFMDGMRAIDYVQDPIASFNIRSVIALWPSGLEKVDANGNKQVVPYGVQFVDHSGPHILSWHWDFGDGTTSREQSPIHVYSDSVSTAIVTLTIVTVFGSASVSRRIVPHTSQQDFESRVAQLTQKQQDWFSPPI